MILYHGSNLKISKIDLNKTRPFKDFGRGFYLTEIHEQAEQMANRVVRLFGGEPFVSEFEVDSKKAENLNTISFDSPNNDWALFVTHNRDKAFTDYSDLLSNHDNKYDIVFGPVANDDIAYLFRTYTSGLMDLENLVKGLSYKKLSSHISFHTQRGIDLLKARGKNE